MLQRIALSKFIHFRCNRILIFLRSFIFNVFIYLWSFIFCIIFSAFLILPVNKLSKIPVLWGGVVLNVARIFLKIHYRAMGMENIPHYPVIFASKHQSAWEVFAMPFILEMPAAIIKKELMNIPFFSLFFKKFNMIPVSRRAVKTGSSKNGDFIEDAKAIIASGRSICIFPEGTRVAIGQQRKFHSGVFRLYHELGVPVIPVALNSGVCWPRRSWMKFPGTVIVKFMPQIDIGLDRGEFLDKLTRIINEESEKLI